MTKTPPPRPSSKYTDCNHHHELTTDHKIITIGGSDVVANVAAIPLLKALNSVGLQTRTHHITNSSEHAFVSIMLDNASIEVRPVHEGASTRTEFNNRYELLLHWSRR